MSRIQVLPTKHHFIALSLVALAGLAAFGPLHAAVGAAAKPAPAPAAAAPLVPGHAASAAASKKRGPPVPAKLVDINSASRTELKTLPGVGDAEADKIVAGRPYLSKAELVTKNVLLTGPYLSLKDHVIAKQKIKPKGKR